ncbi:DoxX family protein [Nocardia gamkensis]|uniref:DoxX family protein n=1 Tax=Nocardia gamkensis TaxID=352869 RepID=UPI0037CCA1D3
MAENAEPGYPVYARTHSRISEILGAMAIAAPRFRLVKEWACAGAFFELAGAFISHMAHGSAVVHHFYPGSFASWASRPASGKPSVPVFRRYGQVTWVEEAQRDAAA